MKMFKYDITLLLGDIELKHLIAVIDSPDSLQYVYMHCNHDLSYRL